MDEGLAIALDSAGNAYVTGSTDSVDFPVMNALSPMFVGNQDVFVSKINPSGSALVYSTYLGGPDTESGNAIAVDNDGNAYVAGSANGPNFPTTATAWQPMWGMGLDAFITKFNAAGSSVLYSSYLGGNMDDDARGIGLDASGSAYITGRTASAFGTFPGPLPGGGADQVLDGGSDAYVAKLSPDGSAISYFTYVGGNVDEEGEGIALDAAANAHVTGATSSDMFPATAGAFQTVFAGVYDAFVVKLNSAGTAFVYGTYLGGAGDDRGHGIALDGEGNAYVTGKTDSLNFPKMIPIQLNNAGSDDAFLTQLNSAGSALVYSTYLGGMNNDRAWGIGLNEAGNAYIIGTTQSSDYPTSNFLTPGGDMLNGPSDAFVTQVNPGGSAIVYSTYLGGGGDDSGWGIAVDDEGNAYVTGQTASADFPTKNPFQTASGGNQDAFVTKIGEVPPLSVSPDNVTVGEGSSVDSMVSGGLPPYTATSGDMDVATVSVSADTVTTTGVAPGSTMITVTDNLGTDVMIDVTVTAVAPPLSVSSDNVTVAEGSSDNVTISGGETPYSAMSDDTSIATASVSGSTLTIEGVSLGSTMIMVTDNLDDNVTIDVTVTEAPPPPEITVGGCDAGINVTDTVDTSEVDVFTLLLCQQIPAANEGRLYVGVAAESVFLDFLFFRPEMAPLPNGSYVQLVRDSIGFLPGAAEAYFFEGILTATSGDVPFLVGTRGLAGIPLVFSSFFLSEGLEINDVNLQLIQVITINFE
jgi:hypothetical protein